MDGIYLSLLSKMIYIHPFVHDGGVNNARQKCAGDRTSNFMSIKDLKCFKYLLKMASNVHCGLKFVRTSSALISVQGCVVNRAVRDGCWPLACYFCSHSPFEWKENLRATSGGTRCAQCHSGPCLIGPAWDPSPSHHRAKTLDHLDINYDPILTSPGEYTIS